MSRLLSENKCHLKVGHNITNHLPKYKLQCCQDTFYVYSFGFVRLLGDRTWTVDGSTCNTIALNTSVISLLSNVEDLTHYLNNTGCTIFLY